MPHRTKGEDAEGADRKAFILRLDSRFHNELRHYALDQHKPLNAIVVEVLETWWKTTRVGRPWPVGGKS